MVTHMTHSILMAAACLSLALDAGQRPPADLLAGLSNPAQWEAMNDSVMGGVSTSGMSASADGTLVFSGTDQQAGRFRLEIAAIRAERGPDLEHGDSRAASATGSLGSGGVGRPTP